MTKKARQAYQYEAPVTPSKWTGEEQRFSIRVKAVLEDLYQKFSSLSGKDASIGGKTWEERLLDIYPVGSIYMSVSSTSPASLFGGTWEQLKDRFLLGAGGSYTAGGTGGESTHKLTIKEMPFHSHIDRIQWMSSGTTTSNVATVDNKPIMPNNGIEGYMTIDAADQGSIGSTGGNGAHNNMPPYLVVYMWKRVE